ncbi:MAG: fructose-6-phosphate aldolase [Lactobacillaceae bacterium]|jgi:TalC/MipB family fructose-6-phosphate aldolase|nr:fructose-6-phosphate aldolase [Lactobacillaceae bacterium]
MEFMFDTANIEDIKKYMDIYPMTGVTSNPSILKAEGRIDLFSHARKIREIIGDERSLHIQVLAKDAGGMINEAKQILANVGKQTYIKIPTTEEGLKAIRVLKKENVNITATAIYSKIQGFMAIACGADFIAPYYNRMENIDIDAAEAVYAFREMIDRNDSKTKILAASFKNISQVNQALLAGAHSITLQPSLLHDVFESAMVKKAVDAFAEDWVSVQGKTGL